VSLQMTSRYFADAVIVECSGRIEASPSEKMGWLSERNKRVLPS
jgi:hypothetical protein